MSDMLASFLQWLHAHLSWWVAFGLLGQGLFTMRFVYQWIASERVKRSVVPEAFWYFSLAGGLVLLIYALHKNDPVFILGQAAGVFIYLRNIVFVRRDKKTDAS